MSKKVYPGETDISHNEWAKELTNATWATASPLRDSSRLVMCPMASITRPAWFFTERDGHMNQVLEQAIVRANPTIFRELEPRLTDGRYFECSDGWYPIINELARRLESETMALGPGRLAVVQVKEKLGGLRVYLRGIVSPSIREWVEIAERQSRQTCELCSMPGELRRRADGMLRTLCEPCALEASYQIESTEPTYPRE